MSPKEIHDNFIKIFEDESPSYSMVKKWAADFRSGRESVEDYELSKVATKMKTLSLCTV